MFSHRALVLLLCLSTGLAATLIPFASAEELPSAVEESNLNKVLEAAGADAAQADAPAEGNQAGAAASTTQDAEEDSEWGLSSIRGSFQAVNGYFDSLLELMGGRDGVCQYRCRYGKQAKLNVDVARAVMCFQWMAWFCFVSITPLLAVDTRKIKSCWQIWRKVLGQSLFLLFISSVLARYTNSGEPVLNVCYVLQNYCFRRIIFIRMRATLLYNKADNISFMQAKLRHVG